MESRKKVLEMLSEGKISVEEAAQLLGKLGEVPRPPVATAPPGLPQSPSPPAPAQPPGLPRFLRVMVDSTDGDKVNVRVPLALLKTGIKLGALIPKEASLAVQEQGFDLSALSELDGEEFLEALRELEVTVDSAKGDKVRVFCE